MSINNSSFYQLIFSEGLYKLKPEVAPEAVAALATKGSPFLFLYKETKQPIDPELLVMLNKMIAAVQLDPAKTPVHNVADQEMDFRVIKATETVKVILAFGCEPKDLQLVIPYKNARPVDHLGIRIFFLDALSHISEVPTRKKFLWTLLKEIFSL